MDNQVTQAILIASAAAGFLAPLLTALINRPNWTSQRKQIVALCVSLALAVIALFFAGAFTSNIPDPATLGVVVLAVIGVSQTVYALVLKTTGLSQKLEDAGSDDAQEILPPDDADEPPRHARGV